MKPRFSILALLAVTGYLAVGLAAAREPTLLWTNRFAYLTLAILAFAGIEAATFRPPRASFAAGFLVGFLAYAALAAYECLLSPRNQIVPPDHRMWLPHEAIGRLIASRNWEPEPGRGEASRVLATVYVASATGLLGSALALWRYRELERRTNAPP